MIHRRPRLRPFLGSSSAPLLLLISILPGCGSGDRSPQEITNLTVDTLSDGTIAISNPATGLWEENGDAWTLTEVMRLGAPDASGGFPFARVVDYELDELGRLYVLDGQTATIEIFGADGSHLRSIGGMGASREEFIGPVGLRWAADGNLWIVDVELSRYSVIDTAGVFLATYQRPNAAFGTTYTSWPGGFGPSGHLYDVSVSLGPSGIRADLIQMEIGAEVTAIGGLTIPPHPSNPMFETTVEVGSVIAAPIPFAGARLWTIGARDDFWLADTDRYEIRNQRLDGGPDRLVQRVFNPVPVSTVERDAALADLAGFEAAGGRLDHSRIPTTKPALRGFFIDAENQLWVQPAVPAGSPGTVDVFDADGRFLGSLEFPPSEDPRPKVRRDHVIGVIHDALDVQQVVVYRIER